MKTYNLFHGFFLSFGASDFYRDVAHHWRGLGFLYVLVLILLTTIPSTAKLFYDTADINQSAIRPVTSQIPRIEIQDGIARVEAPQPHIITDPESGEVIAILDTTGDTTLDDLAPYRNVMLLTEDELIVKQPHRTQVRSLADFEELLGDPAVIDQQTVEGWILWGVGMVKLLQYPAYAGFSYCYRMMQVLVLGVIGLLIASLKNQRLDYTASSRLAAMAITPVILLNTVYELLTPLHSAWCIWWLVCIGLGFGYLFFGISAASRPSPGEGAATGTAQDKFRSDAAGQAPTDSSNPFQSPGE